MSGAANGFCVVFSAEEIGRMAIRQVLAERGLPSSTPCAAALDLLAGGAPTLTVEVGAEPPPAPAAPSAAAANEPVPPAVIAGMTL